MSVGIVGIKLGMSRVFSDEGVSSPVTMVQAKPNLVCQIKDKERDGYTAVQLASGKQKAQRLSKALRGHYASNKIPVSRSLKEIRTSKDASYNIGDKLGVNQFIQGQKVDVTGVSKGKGFAGTIKRWNFSSQDATHGNSISHRHPGSTGQCQFPGKVWKGKKMAGQYGNKRSTVQRLEVVLIDEDKEIIMIKGGIPGAPGSEVIIRPSSKQTLAEKDALEKMMEQMAKKAEEAAAAQEAQQAEPEQADTKVEEEQSTEVQTETKPETTDQSNADTKTKEEPSSDAQTEAQSQDTKKEAKEDAQASEGAKKLEEDKKDQEEEQTKDNKEDNKEGKEKDES